VVDPRVWVAAKAEGGVSDGGIALLRFQAFILLLIPISFPVMMKVSDVM